MIKYLLNSVLLLIRCNNIIYTTRNPFDPRTAVTLKLSRTAKFGKVEYDDIIYYYCRVAKYIPILTSFMFSSSRNLSATDTFSSFCDRNVGRLLCLGSRLPLSTSIRAINRSPSPRSVSRLPMALPAVFKCSLAHRVNVFCWMSFQRASSAKSRSAAPMSSS